MLGAGALPAAAAPSRPAVPDEDIAPFRSFFTGEFYPSIAHMLILPLKRAPLKDYDIASTDVAAPLFVDLLESLHTLAMDQERLVPGSVFPPGRTALMDALDHIRSLKDAIEARDPDAFSPANFQLSPAKNFLLLLGEGSTKALRFAKGMRPYAEAGARQLRNSAHVAAAAGAGAAASHGAFGAAAPAPQAYYPPAPPPQQYTYGPQPTVSYSHASPPYFPPPPPAPPGRTGRGGRGLPPPHPPPSVPPRQGNAPLGKCLPNPFPGHGQWPGSCDNCWHMGHLAPACPFGPKNAHRHGGAGPAPSMAASAMHPPGR